MTMYRISGVGPALFESNGPDAGGILDFIYGTTGEFGILNPDGTRTYVQGTGFIFDWSGTGVVTGGTVTSIVHYDSSGQLLDTLTDLNLAAASLATENTKGTVSFNLATIFAQDDIINARIRTGGAEVSDSLNGYAGNDKIYSGAGNDFVDGGSGNDYVHAATGNDYILGGAGQDRLFGYAGNDVLIGDLATFANANAGDDILYSGRGNDVLMGGGGNDFIDGGDGRDTAAYYVNFADLDISLAQGGLQIISTAGTDRLYGVERIAALDGTFAWSSDGSGYAKISDVTSLDLTAFDPANLLA